MEMECGGGRNRPQFPQICKELFKIVDGKLKN
jgi:hypothetical protein